MNNLLRTLTQTSITGELRLLLTTVKDGRSGDKTEPFFEALENVLNELRTVTLDNHDAEAFLKPVAKSEFPDYYQVILDPMDFQTMQKRCKAKSYRTKAEFNADLEKIWRNCYTYNAIEGHHLHKCVERLKLKAQRLLANVTDRKERSDPHIPMPKQQPQKLKLSLSPLKSGPSTFEDMPAIVRTPEGMAKFARLDAGLSASEEEGERPRKRVKLDEDAENDSWWTMVREPDIMANGIPPTFKSKPRRKKRKPPNPNAGGGLLKIMNANIRTMKRVRRTHAKFSAMNEDVADEEDVDPDADEIEDDPWPVYGQVDEQNANRCLNWMDRKVLEHAGFQGTSRGALDVLAGVTAEYFNNVGRTIKFLSDKHGHTMSAEEIILHTLFESGVTRIQDLERYVKEDVERYGARLGDLERKLVGAYREAASGGIEMDDEAMFEDDDEDEAGVLALGDFSDTLGIDYLGLRELGIADELGITNLTIPKKLLRGKRRLNPANAPTRPVTPPPPYPPPPPFIPLTTKRIDEQIGLLQSVYRSKLGPSYPMLMDPSGNPINNSSQDLEILDDSPAPGQVRMGPLGQIVGALAKGGVSAPKKSSSDKKKTLGGGSATSGSTKKKKLLEAVAAQQGVIVAKG